MTRDRGTGRRFGVVPGGLGAFGGLVLAVSLALASTTGMVTAQGSPSPGVAGMSAEPSMSGVSSVIPVRLVDFAIDPARVEAAGTTLVLDVVNEGPTPHNLTIRDAAGAVLGATADLREGEAEQLTLTLPAPGTYVTFCSLPGHESLGVVGELVVTDTAAPVLPSPVLPSPVLPSPVPGASPMTSPSA